MHWKAFVYVLGSFLFLSITMANLMILSTRLMTFGWLGGVGPKL